MIFFVLYCICIHYQTFSTFAFCALYSYDETISKMLHFFDFLFFLNKLMGLDFLHIFAEKFH